MSMKEALGSELRQPIADGAAFQKEELDQLLVRAPYSAVLWAIRAGMAHHEQDPVFENLLSQAAARVFSRARLRDWIEGSVQLDWDLNPVTETEAEVVSGLEQKADHERNFPEPTEVLPELADEEVLSPVPTALPELEVRPESEALNLGFAPALIADSVPEPEILTEFPATDQEEIQASDSETDSDPEAPLVEPGTFLPTAKVLPEKNRFGFGFVKVKPPAAKVSSIKKEKKTAPEPGFSLPVEASAPSKKKNRPEEKLIDKFLEKAPQLGPPRIQFGQEGQAEDLSRRSVELAEEIVTENMAMIYLKQKQYAKALETFRKLQLKFPDKSDYFAALIKNLENQHPSK